MTQDSNYWKTRPLDDTLRDFDYGKEDWIEDYWASYHHPHRKLLVDEIIKFQPQEVLEIGCNVGVNLAVLRDNYKIEDKDLAGIDPNEECIKRAKERLGAIIFTVETAQDPMYNDKSFDVVFADATLMYIPDTEIKEVIANLNRIAKKAIIICDRFNESELGVTDGHIWSRNYTKLLQDLGLEVQEIPLTAETWPTSINWQQHGKLFVGSLPLLQTSEQK